MKSIIIDTCALIALIDVEHPHNEVAVRLVSSAYELGYVLYLSSIVAAEYSVKGNINDVLEMKPFSVLNFDLRHAREAGRIQQELRIAVQQSGDTNISRTVIINDTKIIAQANIEECSYILTLDKKTLAAKAKKIDSCVKTLLLQDGYHANLLIEDGGQMSLGI